MLFIHIIDAYFMLNIQTEYLTYFDNVDRYVSFSVPILLIVPRLYSVDVGLE